MPWSILGRPWRILGLFLAVAAAFAPSGVIARPRMIITVDVESTPTLSLPEQVDLVCGDGKPCGLMEIVRMLKQRGLAGTFFLNAYEHREWGEPVMRRIAGELQSAGQDVELHTHPQWAYDPARPGMNQYSLDEQTTILREGIRLLTAWTGQPVVAHRAGDYAADERTLEALKRSGILIDSSMFAGHPSNHLELLGLPRNLVSTPSGLLEIPVTVYLREERPRLFGDFVAPVGSIRKIDCDWFEDDSEARSTIDSLVAADPQFIVVFLHSFSFIAASGKDGAPVARRRSQTVLQSILDRAQERGLEIVTMRDIAGLPAMAAATQQHDVIPQVSTRVGWHRYLWHRWRSANAGGKAVAVTCLVVVAFSLGWVVVLSAQRWHAPYSGIKACKNEREQT